LQLKFGILAFLSLLADSIQIIEFLNQHIETMKDLIKMAAFAVGTTMVTYPLCSTDLATCAGRAKSRLKVRELVKNFSSRAAGRGANSPPAPPG
jgi:hypothetical protein